MRKAAVLYKDKVAGHITQHDDGSFTFAYSDDWVRNSEKPPISLTLPKTQKKFHSKTLFPFFYNMLPEGSNREAVCRFNRIDRDDDFGVLCAVGRNDTVGAVRVLTENMITHEH